MSSKEKAFSIDDAFETDDDTNDAIRLYGSTNDSKPPKPVETLTPDNVYIRMPINGSEVNSRLIPMPEDALSKDSDSLITDGSFSPQFDPRKSWWKHPKVRTNWKIVVAAFVLFFIGTGLLITGIIMYTLPELGNIPDYYHPARKTIGLVFASSVKPSLLEIYNKPSGTHVLSAFILYFTGIPGLVFFVTGTICFIPGVYHVVYVYFATKGKRGFEFSHLPLFN
ncbi:Transmembrane protein 134 [Nymphon striatum]|nr:Transmembrane protein 134 [Nymphon striatum]